MTSRSWRWFVVRIQGLLNHPERRTRIAVALTRTDDRGGFDDA